MTREKASGEKYPAICEGRYCSRVVVLYLPTRFSTSFRTKEDGNMHNGRLNIGKVRGEPEQRNKRYLYDTWYAYP
jgi:hypothetical protein